MPTKAHLRELQSLPLNLKVALTKQRIREWVSHYGGDDVVVSFSGGKDSTVLLHICRSMYPNIKAVYFDTGLEFPEIRNFVKTFDNVDWIKPKMNFKEVIIKYGYPFISKEVSEVVGGAKKYLTKLNEEGIISQSVSQSVSQSSLCLVEFALNNSQELAEILNDRMKNRKGGSNQRLAQMLGMLTKDGQIKANVPNKDLSYYSQAKWRFLLNAPFEISNKCCNIMKKSLAHDYMKKTGRYSITGQMAAESMMRTQKWLQNGCNGFNLANPVSNPMSFWFEDDVLLYIKLNNIKIASVYGDIIVEKGELNNSSANLGIFELERPCLKTTKCDRTGCCMCGFGVHMEKQSRFTLIDEVSNHNLRDYIMRGGAFDENGLWKPDKRGLGYWFVIQWINKYGNLNIYIPEYERYEKEYGNELTRQYI